MACCCLKELDLELQKKVANFREMWNVVDKWEALATKCSCHHQLLPFINICEGQTGTPSLQLDSLVR